MHYDWWQQTTQTATGAPAPINKSPQLPTQKDVSAWWLQEDVVWSKTESERDEGINGAIERSLQAGIEVITTGKSHQVLLPTNTAAETLRADEVSGLTLITSNTQARSQRVSEAALQTSAPPLSATLAHLMENWSQFDAQNRRVGVVLVRGDTSLSPTDLTMFRRLVLLGQLYLVSDNEQVLSFLAQRLYSRSQTLEFRLAKTAQALAALLRDTIVEASGGNGLT